MNKIKWMGLFATGVASLGLVTSVMAAMPVPYGWYAEGNMGKSTIQGKTYPGFVKNNGFGWNVNGGYKFTPFFGAEVGYTHYGETRIQNTVGTTAATDKHYSYDLTGKLILPVGVSGFDVFGKLGVARLNSYEKVTNANAAALNGLTFNTGTHSATGIYVGAGADYAILPNVLANVQWARANGSNSTGNFDLYSLGIAYIA